MKALLLILILTFSFSAFGQETQPGWQAFTSSLEEFTLDVPTAFISIVLPNASDKEKPRSYSAFSDKTYYFVFSDNPSEPLQNKMAYAYAGDYESSGMDRAVFFFTDRFNYHHRILTLKTPNRVYTFQTVSKEANNPDADRFFSGIKIGGKKPKLIEKIAVQTIRPADPIRTGGEGPGIGSRIRSGNGISGVGIGSGSGPSGQTSGVKILSKPRSSYTEYAKNYQIVGTVRLRVVFEADGNIGAITPVTGLPFGLTEAAVEAARQMKFDPATRNGQPVTSTKVVEYTFTIY